MAYYKLTPKGKARVIRNYLAASWSSAVGDDALGVPRCGSDICLMTSEILR